MPDGENSVGAIVNREGYMTVGLEFKPMAFFVVTNVPGHVTVSAQSSSTRNLVRIATFPRCPMPTLTLYHASPSRSSVALWMLEEIGQPHDIKLLRLSAADNMKPDYLAINPMGKVPALRHGDTVITELAAICTY